MMDSKHDLKNSNIAENIYLSSLFLFIFVGVLKTSLVVPAHLSMGAVFAVFKVTGLVVILNSFFGPHSTWRWKIILVMATVGGYLLSIPSQNFDFFYYLIFVLGAHEIRFTRILKIYIFSALIGILSVLFLCFIGVIPNELFGRQGLSLVRNSFGFFTPTDFAARIFFVLLAYYVLNEFVMSWKENVVVVVTILLVYHFTNARLDTFLLLLLFACGFVGQKLKKVVQRLQSTGVFLISLIYILANVLISVFYTPQIWFFDQLNKALSGRIQIGQQALHEKGITLFGQHFHEQGNGMLPGGNFRYFYIDSSYLRLLIISGVLISLIMLVVSYYTLHNFMVQRKEMYAIGFMLVIISSAIDQHFLDPSYNVMFLGLLAQLKISTNYKKLQKNKA